MTQLIPYVNFRDGWACMLIGRYHILVNMPWCPPLFSERYGYRKPVFSLRGWRLFVKRIEDRP